jgi:hypothetical protein
MLGPQWGLHELERKLNDVYCFLLRKMADSNDLIEMEYESNSASESDFRAPKRQRRHKFRTFSQRVADVSCAKELRILVVSYFARMHSMF